MIFPAAARNGVFFKVPPSGHRFACVENLRRRAFGGIHELCRERRHAGQPLDKIQRDALGAQNRARRAGNFQQARAGFDAPAVFGQAFNFDRGGKFAERRFGKIESGDNQRFARAQDRLGRRGYGHDGKRCCVTAADVLGQGGLDGATDFCGGQFHAVKMKANGKREKEKQQFCRRRQQSWVQASALAATVAATNSGLSDRGHPEHSDLAGANGSETCGQCRVGLGKGDTGQHALKMRPPSAWVPAPARQSAWKGRRWPSFR